ncbi:flagellar FlbD family protein [Chryseomicrobium aureum]|uniref:flagellar FlbD family protein n=1 Tax=Chryseomicrobium aureum TaxID=1441723 RepID=UPI00195993F8|nr:flagellar FlbD family protein [Chryseomicrobium aureum]MBM7705972.1 flagellar protein FlbD [Chryseomicrobium aureum]
MIEVTKLNRTPLTINALLIERIEETPDTYITFTTGKTLHVLESKQDVVNRVTAFYQQIGLFSAQHKSSN